MLPDKLAFVDIETTGTSARYGRIIEIGIVRVENNVIAQTYHTLINPETHLPPEIELLTGITPLDLNGQPTFRQVKRDILEMLVDCVFVAHNVRFDYSFLRYEFKRENIDFIIRHFCTVKLSRALFPSAKHHNLDAIIERFGFSCKKRHRAFEDAKILWDFYQKVQQQIPAETFIKAVNMVLRRPAMPINLKQEDLDNLPEQPGVYVFYGAEPHTENQTTNSASLNKQQPANQIPLYIGKSKNIRDRVLSHFAGDIHSPKEMNIAQQVTSIETIVTAGELGALFLEAQLVKKYLPLYNRLLRFKRELIALTKILDKKGYETVSMESFQVINPEKLDSFIGFFKSRREAKNFLIQTAEEFCLCEKLLGLEKTNTACFAHRLNRCKGACIGKEDPLFYNLRFTTAFFKTKIKPWPFKGPIIIKEQNELTGITEHFFIDKWCFLGKVNVDEHYNQSTSQPENQPTAFDLDMYKILVRFMNNPKNKNSLIPLTNYPIINTYSGENIS